MITKNILVALVVLVSCVYATRFRVNKGCVTFQRGDGRIFGQCSGKGLDVSPPITVWGRLEGGKGQKTKAGCKKEFHWPSNYGEVFYGADNCLYDAKSNRIDGQCCDGGGGDEVFNPYRG
ncbi:uncharacterized protein LOC129583105 [Paramacrobiotus metropolitanus]|uniref:uncharacterized protein LOC129583105 n=1 Tax=Paramacrobiotus metropolitanus TaxID=2943436 RepID=UPI0024457DFE|nr:uncharacterized protein LOC129583105 [Paramacrobiotus metropolitanus]